LPDLVDLLGHVGGQLEKAERLEDVQQIVRVTTRRLLDAQGATFVLLEDDACYYADEDSISPLWKGQRFPAATCIGGWAMDHRQTVVIPDIRTDPRIPQEAYRGGSHAGDARRHGRRRARAIPRRSAGPWLPPLSAHP
jgi:GAF domain-containing protein